MRGFPPLSSLKKMTPFANVPFAVVTLNNKIKTLIADCLCFIVDLLLFIELCNNSLPLNSNYFPLFFLQCPGEGFGAQEKSINPRKALFFSRNARTFKSFEESWNDIFLLYLFFEVSWTFDEVVFVIKLKHFNTEKRWTRKEVSQMGRNNLYSNSWD